VIISIKYTNKIQTMKILAINGSHRKGNTDFMIDIILKVAKGEHIRLREKDIQFCSGGDYCCPMTFKCDKRDDMSDIYKKLELADIIILASPCYFFNVTARMKNFMDRCNPYYFSKKLKGKKFFLITVGGHKPSLKGAITAMKNFVNGICGTIIGNYSTVADKACEVNNQKVIKELQDIGKKLLLTE